MISEPRMSNTVGTLMNETEGNELPGVCRFSECRDRKWETKSQKVRENGFGRDGGGMAQTKATHFAVLTTVIHSLKSQCLHIENTYTKHCNSNSPIVFLFLQLSLDIARVTFNLNNHKLGKCTWRSHSTHDLNVH